MVWLKGGSRQTTKRFWKYLGALVFVIPFALTTLFACALAQNGTFFHHFPFLKKDQYVIHFTMPNLERKNITTYPNDLAAIYQTDLLVGGFEELRHIYAPEVKNSSNWNFFHAGDDIMVPYQTKIYTPFDAEVVAAIWMRRQNNPLASGLGGQVVLRVQVATIQKDYPWFQPPHQGAKIVYIGIAHLSKNSINLLQPTAQICANLTLNEKYNWKIATQIDIDHPFKITKGQLLGKVGSTKENGGWITHLHVEVHGENGYLAKKLARFKISGLSQKKLGSYYRLPKLVGSYLATRKQLTATNFHEVDLKQKQWFQKREIIAPNAIFHFYDPTTKTVVLNN